MCIEVEAIICMRRFRYLGHWKACLDYLSRKNLDGKILEHPLLTMPCDRMLVRYVFDKPYQILALSRGDWSVVHMHAGRKYSVWYADGSKMDKGTYADVFCPDKHLGYSWSLRKFSNVFLIEVYAILICCRICMYSHLL